MSDPVFIGEVGDLIQIQFSSLPFFYDIQQLVCLQFFIRFLYFVEQFVYAADTFGLSTILADPNGQGSTPEPRAAEIPVHHILQPVAKTSFTGCFWLPVDGL